MYEAYFHYSQCPFLICRNDQYSTIIEANQAFYNLVGYTKSEFSQLFANHFSAIVIDNLDKILSKITNSLSNNEKVIDYEYRIRAKSGAIIWIHDVATYNEATNVFFITLMDVSYKAKQLDQLLFENQFDAMTSIFNRATFESELHKQQQRAYREQALFIIDLDNFKQVNDDYGHQTGDYLLMKIGENFKKITHKHQILIGRLGGDEFVAYLSSDELADEIVAVSKQIMSQLTIKVQDITVTASCGIVYDQQNQLDFQTLYTLADQTMYDVKNNQKNNFKITIINEVQNPTRMTLNTI